MDKQTLSGYGWIVIVSLVMAVMLALATPFGDYVGSGLVEISRAYVQTSNEALEEDHISKLEDKWENKFGYCIIGDVNNDGVIDGNDSTLIGQIVGWEDAMGYNLASADINQDGKVEQGDYIAHMYYVVSPETYKDYHATCKMGSDALDNKVIKIIPKSSQIALGDVNRDGEINSDDVIATLEMVKSGISNPYYSLDAADGDADEDVDIDDVTSLLLYVSMPDQFPQNYGTLVFDYINNKNLIQNTDATV